MISQPRTCYMIGLVFKQLILGVSSPGQLQHSEIKYYWCNAGNTGTYLTESTVEACLIKIHVQWYRWEAVTSHTMCAAFLCGHKSSKPYSDAIMVTHSVLKATCTYFIYVYIYMFIYTFTIVLICNKQMHWNMWCVSVVLLCVLGVPTCDCFSCLN